MKTMKKNRRHTLKLFTEDEETEEDKAQNDRTRDSKPLQGRPDLKWLSVEV